MVKAAIVAAILWSAATAAQAGYVENRQQWNELSYAQKVGFVMGVYDGINIIYAGDPDSETMVLGTTACFKEQKTTATDLIAMVEIAYREVKEWTSSPAEIIMFSKNDMCWRYINVERAKRDLKPWPAR